MFLYLVNRRIPVDFRQFLIRHLDLFRFLHTWTVRLLVPRRFRKAVALYKAAAPRGALDSAESERQQVAGDVLSRTAGAGRTPRRSVRSLHRAGVPEAGHAEDPGPLSSLATTGRQGALAGRHSTCLRDDRSYGCSAVEVQLLNRQYLQLTGSMDRDVWAKRGAKRKSRQVGRRPMMGLSCQRWSAR